MNHRLPQATSVIACASLVLVSAAATRAEAASARSDLYSASAVSRFCVNAQKVVSTTALTAINVIHVTNITGYSGPIVLGNVNDFIYSSPAPYDGPNISQYNAPYFDGPALPLTVQQVVTYRDAPSTGMEVPVIISCKMKSSEGLQHHFGADAAGAQASCRTMNQQVVASVFATLTMAERRYLVFNESQVVFDDDVFQTSGPTWVGSIPTLLPRVLSASGGLLHVFSPALTVPVNSQDPNIGDSKKGTYYCQFPAPEYVRGVVTGQLPIFYPY